MVTLAAAVAKSQNVSRSVAKRLIVLGCVRLNGVVCRVMLKPVHQGDTCDVTQLEMADAVLPPQTVQIIEVTPTYVVIDKPAYLLSEPDRFNSPSVLSKTPPLLPGRTPEREPLWLVHRLDATTSGVMILARRKSMCRTLSNLWQQGVVRKTYLALAQGEMAEQTVSGGIGRVQGSKHAVLKGGAPSVTDFEPLKYLDGITLVRVSPHTGRTHQIRVHAAHVGHPLLGDHFYGGSRRWHGHLVSRAMLHAYQLHLPTPIGRTFTAPPPADFLALAMEECR